MPCYNPIAGAGTQTRRLLEFLATNLASCSVPVSREYVTKQDICYPPLASLHERTHVPTHMYPPYIHACTHTPYIRITHTLTQREEVWGRPFIILHSIKKEFLNDLAAGFLPPTCYALQRLVPLSAHHVNSSCQLHYRLRPLTHIGPVPSPLQPHLAGCVGAVFPGLLPWLWGPLCKLHKRS